MLRNSDCGVGELDRSLNKLCSKLVSWYSLNEKWELFIVMKFRVLNYVGAFNNEGTFKDEGTFWNEGTFK
jgi:hypothetical protein